MKPQVSFHWSHVVMGKVSLHAEPSGRHLSESPSIYLTSALASRGYSVPFDPRKAFLSASPRSIDCTGYSIVECFSWGWKFSRPTPYSLQKIITPKQTHPRIDPAKSIFLPETPACLSMLPEKTFSTKRRLYRLSLLLPRCASNLARRAACADESRLPVQVLPLNLVQEVEIALVKVVHSDVTVLSSGRVALAGGVRGDGVLTARVSMQAR